MASTVLIPELAIVELTNPDEPNGRELVFGVVVSGREPNGSYAIAVVNRRTERRT